MPIDMSMASKAPPARSGTTRTRAPKASIGDQREQAVLGIFQGGQAICLMVRQYADAATIGQNAAPIAREVSSLAATDDKVAKLVDSLLVVGPYTALAMAVLPMAMQLAVNHGILPAGKIPGTMNPAVLATGIEAEMAQQAAAMMEEAEEAKRAAEEKLRSLNGSGVPE